MRGRNVQNGDTQWMTAGAGILHDEMPPEELVRTGGLFHGVQIWVNLPKRLKWTPPRYQSLESSRVTLLASAQGDVLLRVIAGEVGGHQGPGSTWIPVTVIHASLEPGARLRLPWPEEFNALAYVLEGAGSAGPEAVLIHEGQGVQWGSGQGLTVSASPVVSSPSGRLEILLLGGVPLREPIASYGPFVMNSHADIVQAFEDYQSGKMGAVPAVEFNPDAESAPHG